MITEMSNCFAAFDTQLNSVTLFSLGVDKITMFWVIYFTSTFSEKGKSP